MNPREHALFQRYPLNGTAALSTGTVPTPYHIYDGYGVLVGGLAALDAVRGLLKHEQVLPVQSANGSALMGVWICDFTDASLGPHHELQISFFVAPGPVAPAAERPVGLLAAMLLRPDVQMLCYRLWNNHPTVVAYNRELLSLDARLAESTIQAQAERLDFQAVEAGGALACRGSLARPNRPALPPNLAFLAQVGVRKAAQVARQPWLRMQVVNPTGVRLPRNAVAHAYSKNDATNLQYIDPATDWIAFGPEELRALNFRPLFKQQISGWKFVYRAPGEAE